MQVKNHVSYHKILMTGGGGGICEQKHFFPSLQRMFMTGGVDGGVGVHMLRRTNRSYVQIIYCGRA